MTNGKLRMETNPYIPTAEDAPVPFRETVIHRELWLGANIGFRGKSPQRQDGSKTIAQATTANPELVFFFSGL